MTTEETNRHDRSWCAVCGREFWGVIAFDKHRPCHTGEWRSTSPEDWIVLDYKGDERASYRQWAGAPLVLMSEWDLFVQKQEHMQKVRSKRGGK